MIRTYLIAALAVALALSLGGVIWLNAARNGAETRARAAATAIERANTITLRSDKANETGRLVTEKANTNADKIQSAAGASDPLPVDVRAAWANGLRDNATIAGDAPAKPDQPMP